MKGNIEVGDLVRDKLNDSHHSYGLGVVVEIGESETTESNPTQAPKKYAVYFTRFNKTLTFHGDYLERV